MSDFKLTSYSSDDLPKPDFPMTYKERVIYNGNMNSNRFGKPIKSKKERREENRNKLFSKTEPLELDEWFVYLVDGEKWYYKVAQDLSILKMHHNAEFLGIGRLNKIPHKIINHNQAIQIESQPVKLIKESLNERYEKRYAGKTCCYCEIKLNGNNGSKEHIIPKHRGGKITRPCCKDCNTEKGGLMLHSYIQFLNLKMLEVTGIELQKLQTKIANANRLAKEIENNLK